MSEWQPITTAPKDGETSILVFNPAPYAGGRIAVAIWSDDRWHFDTVPFRTLTPTHWQPLPAPPEAA